jgi:hypothetical protein
MKDFLIDSELQSFRAHARHHPARNASRRPAHRRIFPPRGGLATLTVHCARKLNFDSNQEWK